MRYNKLFFQTILCLLIILSSNYSIKAEDGKENIQKKYFTFLVDLFKWSAKSQAKIEDHEDREEIYFRFSNEEYESLVSTFEKNRSLLCRIKKISNIKLVNGINVLPEDLHNVLVHIFSLKKCDEKFNSTQLLSKIIGKKVKSHNDKITYHKGFLDVISELDMNKWDPIKDFIDKLKTAITIDPNLSDNLGKFLLPFIESYYQKMDNISRLKIFKEISELIYLGFPDHTFLKKVDHLTSLVFQNSGPVLIKFIQQLQEEITGESCLSEVISSLKKSKPMDYSRVHLKVKNILNELGVKEYKRFKVDEKPIGIASIGQVHKLTIRNDIFIVKLIKDQVKNIFSREKRNINKIFEDPKLINSFDGGQKKIVNNLIFGIEEEINFYYEKENILLGNKVYDKKFKEFEIKSITMPSWFETSKHQLEDKPLEILFMNLAHGHPLSKIIREGNDSELLSSYKAVSGLYGHYLHSAIGNGKNLYFFHGDLHRDNIFIDFDKEDNTSLTLIDFGNASLLKEDQKNFLINLLIETNKTMVFNERNQDKSILKIGKIIKEYLLKDRNNNFTKKDHDTLDIFFDTCFNPNSTIIDKQLKSADIFEYLQLLQCNKDKIIGNKSVKNEKIRTEIQNSIDLVKSMLNNCLNGSSSSLLPVLASQDTVSNKLNIVFTELIKNGIGLPKNIVFFNKSKLLLEGIVNNIENKIEERNLSYNQIDLDHIFLSFIKKLKKNS